MKYLLLIFLISTTFSCESYFQGEVKYSVTTEVLGDSLRNTKLINQLIIDGIIHKDSVSYFYSNSGNYKINYTLHNKKIPSYYIKSDKMLYSFIGDNIVTGLDITIDLEQKLGNKPKIKLLDYKQKIGNYDCSIVEIIWKTGVYRYYFSKGIMKIDKDNYKNYNYNQWYSYLNISNSLPIRVEHEINGFYKTTYTLDYFKNKNIPNSIFKLPKMTELKELKDIYIYEIVDTK
ncbi:MAG: hypothetical protein H6604_01845 [Flavobacteriales bacterium]|nr:hypothetical protein [Flavobacteriales bacterium]